MFSLISQQANTYEKHWDFYHAEGGKGFPQDHLDLAYTEIEELCEVLRQEGVIVKRPDPVKWDDWYETPDFKSQGMTELTGTFPQ